MKPDAQGRLDELQTRLGLRFRNVALLEQSLVHRSLLRDQALDSLQSNERLEFLGDAIIGYLVASYLFEHRPTASEGELTLMRTWLVRASTLGSWAAELDLTRYLRLGRSDEGGKRRTRLLARTFEAVVGAIYADQGARAVAKFLRPFIVRECRRFPEGRLRLDAKSRLQQVTQSRFDLMPVYTVLSVTGPGHDPSFSVEVTVGDKFQAVADGGTKQEAEQAAARLALASLDPVDGTEGAFVEVAPAPVAEAHLARDLGDAI